MVFGTAGIAVITGDVQEFGLTFARHANFRRARVAIVALHHEPGDALAIAARVIKSAGVVVVARTGHRHVEAATLGRTGILGTRIVVVAVLQLSGHALTGHAGIIQSAGIAIVAVSGGGQILTPRLGVTAVGRAVIAVIAHHVCAANANTSSTAVALGTRIAVVTGKLVILVETPGLGVAEILRTGVVVSAIGTAGTAADPGGANLTQTAGIAIITGKAVMGGFLGTHARLRVTNGTEAK